MRSFLESSIPIADWLSHFAHNDTANSTQSQAYTLLAAWVGLSGNNYFKPHEEQTVRDPTERTLDSDMSLTRVS